jgi:hypothetical protein
VHSLSQAGAKLEQPFQYSQIALQRNEEDIQASQKKGDG